MFSFKRGVVGLDIGSSSVKAIELRPKGTAFELMSLGYAVSSTRHYRGRSDNRPESR